MNCKCQHPSSSWLHLKLLLVLLFIAKLKKFFGVETLYFAGTDHSGGNM